LILLASIGVSGACTTVGFAVAHDFRAVRPKGDREWRQKEDAAQRALNTILLENAGRHNLAMGEGAVVTDYRTDLRFELPLAGQDYFFDENALIEGIRSGYPTPQNVIDRVNGCGSIWIFPHGEAPFSSTRVGVLPITTTPFIFPDAMRLHFGDRHAVFQQGPVYDLWKCPTDASSNESP
jgi:hypothetical protein